MENKSIQNSYSDVVLGKMPTWIIRWGILFVLTMLLIFFLIADHIKCPQVISSTINFIENTDTSKTNENKAYIVGLMTINTHGMIIPKKHMTVLIELKHYKTSEYGIIEAEINTVDVKDSEYIITIKLNENCKTSLGKTLKLKSGLVGKGNILITQKTLFDNILEPIKTLF